MRKPLIKQVKIFPSGALCIELNRFINSHKELEEYYKAFAQAV